MSSPDASGVTSSPTDGVPSRSAADDSELRGSLRLLSERVARYEQDGSPGSLGITVAEVVTFKGCEDLRRGSPLDKVMHRQGRIFGSSKGSAATFAMSRPVEQIDAFLSHNWSVPRQWKFASLAVHFNFGPALLAMSATVSVVAGLTGAGFLPTYDVSWSDYPRGISCRIVSAPVFLLALGSVHRAARKTVFLDVTCIDQVDPDVQRQGIEKLGAFLRHSATMVAVYSDVYLKRLWTVYEVANFLALHPIEHMYIVPTVVPLVLIVGVVLAYLSNISGMLLEAYCDFYYASRLTCLGLGFFYVLALRSWGRERAAMRLRLKDFSLSKCACEDESDRPLVYGNIAALMRAARAVGTHAGDEEALAAFDEVVRGSLGRLMITSIGLYGLRWRHMLTVAFLTVGPTYLDKLAGVARGAPLRVIAVDLLWYANIVCCTIPLTFAIWAECAALCLHLRGLSEVLFISCGAMSPGCAFGLVSALVMDKLVRWGYASIAGLWVLVVFSVLKVMLTFLVFRREPRI